MCLEAQGNFRVTSLLGEALALPSSPFVILEVSLGLCPRTEPLETFWGSALSLLGCRHAARIFWLKNIPKQWSPDRYTNLTPDSHPVSSQRPGATQAH